MQKRAFLGFILFMSLVMLSACKDAVMPPAADNLGTRNVWIYEDPYQDDRIITEADTLTYTARDGTEQKITGLTVPKDIENLWLQTEGAIAPNEAIMDWIVKENKVYAFIFKAIDEDHYNATGKIKYTGEPKLLIFDEELQAELRVTKYKGKYIFLLAE
jgi:predicted GH43/DUF377 family glycosyl hydrolase